MTGAIRTYGPLHFEDLEPRRFEDLVRQLIYDFRPWRALEATGRAGSDDGFDARGFELIDVLDFPPTEENDEETQSFENVGNDRTWLIQCKREKIINPAKMQKHLNDIPFQSTADLYGVIFVAACDFSKKTHDVFRAWCRSRGISEARIWGKGELEDQLYQPKNDGLLFAYFGFSLQIRRRSVKTALRSRLAMKRKAERSLDGYQAVLLRDPTDDRYPWAKEGEEPARWRVAQFSEHHPLGIVLLVRRYFAYLSDDKEQWDYIEQSKSSGVNPHDDYWHVETESGENIFEQNKIWRFWSKLPDANRANYCVYELIKYDDVIEIDEKGDAAARMPHIYLERVHPRKENSFVENSVGYNPTKIQLPNENRITFFPKEFPEIEELADDS